MPAALIASTTRRTGAVEKYMTGASWMIGSSTIFTSALSGMEKSQRLIATLSTERAAPEWSSSNGNWPSITQRFG